MWEVLLDGTVASSFGEKVREIEGLESLEEDFYTRFMIENRGFGL